jgi:hypothetical protein
MDYVLVAVVSTHFPRWSRDSPTVSVIIILTVAETIINQDTRRKVQGRASRVTELHYYDNTLLK